MPSTNRFGSKPGMETKASTPPVPGSIATSAPRRSPKARSATSCRPMSRVSVTLLPGCDAARDSVRMPRPPASISTLLDAGDAVQLLLVARLDAGLADVVGAAVVGGIAQLFQPLLVARG